MTQTVLTSNAPSGFRANFLNRIRLNKRLSIVSFILHMISAPLLSVNLVIYSVKMQKYRQLMLEYTANNMSDYFRPSRPEFPYFIVIIAVLATAAAAFMGIMYAISNYDYLLKKTKVDMILSLPMSSTQRFFSDYLSGLTGYLAPFLAASVFTVIISSAGALFVTNFGSDFELASSLPVVMLQLILFGFFLMLMIYTLTVLVITCCGNLFEAAMYTLGINAIIPAMILTFSYVLTSDLYGFTGDSGLPILRATSPAGGVLAIIELYVREYVSGSGTPTFGAVMLNWFLPFVMVTAVYLAAAFLLNRYRKAEWVSKPFVYKAFYYVLITCGMFILISLFLIEGTDDLIVPMIITTAITYFILEAIANRGFKKFGWSVLRYVATVIGCAVILVTFRMTDGFGSVYTVPAPISVTSVDFSAPMLGSKDYYNNFRTTLRDKENIERIAVIHKSATDDYKNSNSKLPGNNAYGNIEINIAYSMLGGSVMTRSYDTDYSLDAIKALCEIQCSEEYNKQLVKQFKDEFVFQAGINASNRTDNINVTPEEIRLDNGNMSFVIVSDASSYEDINGFFNSLESDLLALGFEQRFHSSEEVLGYVSYRDYSIPINKNFVNTVNFIKTRTTGTLNENYCINSIVSNKTYYLGSAKVSQAPNQSLYYTDSESRVVINADDVSSLMRYAQPFYYTENPVFVVLDSRHCLFIPESKSEPANKIYAENEDVLSELLTIFNFSEYDYFDIYLSDDSAYSVCDMMDLSDIVSACCGQDLIVSGITGYRVSYDEDNGLFDDYSGCKYESVDLSENVSHLNHLIQIVKSENYI